MKNFLDNLPKRAKEKNSENKRYFAKLKRKKPKKLDVLMQQIHNEEFQNTNCLTCANCCKTTSPIITERDIARISKFLRLKETDFVKQYLQLDTDGLYMFQQVPCPFLDEKDNKCFIYDIRPKACSEYPHTNRKRFTQITDITLKNIEICPATFQIIEELKRQMPL